MNPKAACEILAEIEQRFDVNSLYYKDLRVWPLIRKALWGQWMAPWIFTAKQASKQAPHHRNAQAFLPSKISGIVKAPVRRSKAALRYLINQRVHQRQLASLCQNGTVDILFFSWPSDYTNQFGGKLYNHFVDPMTDLVRERYSFLKLELNSDRKQKTLPRFEPTTFINPPYSPLRVLRRAHRVDRTEGFEELQGIILQVAGHVQLEPGRIIERALNIERHQAFFVEILTELRPRAIFSVRLNPMALMWASKKLGIPTVDIQHCKQGKYHPMYTHWTKIPDDGYELLPDFYWCWGEQSRYNIARWQPPGCRHHRPVVGGNRWLAKWTEGDGFSPSNDVETFLERLRRVEIVILVTLQPINDPLPAHVLDAMQRSPSTWLWLVRLHPSQRGMREQVRALLERHGVHNFEIECATRAPLYALLKQSDHHITCWSSVCYEALSFYVPTTIVHPIGLELYHDYIDQGIFTYVQNGDALLAAIKKVYSKEQLKEPVPYIDTSRQRAEEALGMILH